MCKEIFWGHRGDSNLCLGAKHTSQWSCRIHINNPVWRKVVLGLESGLAATACNRLLWKPSTSLAKYHRERRWKQIRLNSSAGGANLEPYCCWRLYLASRCTPISQGNHGRDECSWGGRKRGHGHCRRSWDHRAAGRNQALSRVWGINDP